MPEVSVVVELRVRIGEPLAPVALERAIAAEGRRAARELYRGVVQVLDERVTGASGGARQRLEPRWVATTVGRIQEARFGPVGAVVRQEERDSPGPGALTDHAFDPGHVLEEVVARDVLGGMILKRETLATDGR